jgi:hypothetical protein
MNETASPGIACARRVASLRIVTARVRSSSTWRRMPSSVQSSFATFASAPSISSSLALPVASARRIRTFASTSNAPIRSCKFMVFPPCARTIAHS